MTKGVLRIAIAIASTMALSCGGARTSCERDGWPTARPTRAVAPTHDAMPRVVRTGQSAGVSSLTGRLVDVGCTPSANELRIARDGGAPDAIVTIGPEGMFLPFDVGDRLAFTFRCAPDEPSSHGCDLAVRDERGALRLAIVAGHADDVVAPGWMVTPLRDAVEHEYGAAGGSAQTHFGVHVVRRSHAWDLPPSMPWTLVDDESGAYWLLAHATAIEGLTDDPGFVGFAIVLIGR